MRSTPEAFCVAFAVALSLAPRTGRAAGFLLYEAGAKAMGLGGAMTAVADDASAIFYNPAGLMQLQGTNAYGGFSLVFTGTEFAGVDPDPGFNTFDETGALLFTPFSAYISHRLANEKWSIGLGLFTPFGLGQKWRDRESFTGRHIADKAQLFTFYANPTVAWQATPQLSVGGGIQLVHGRVELNRFIQQWDPNGEGFLNIGLANLQGHNIIDFGVNAGLLWKPRDEVSLGLNYRSQVTFEAKGDADFAAVPSGSGAVDDAVPFVLPTDQGVSAEVKLPWLLALGGAYYGVEHWVFAMDLVYAGWSRFDELSFSFTNPSLNTTRVEDFEDKLSVRLGAGYDIIPDVQVRLGYYYDPTPMPRKAMSPLLADANRHGITFGVGYGVGQWMLDGFVLILITDKRSTSGESLDGYNGVYSTFGHVYGLNVGYSF